jgi:hypothetical protein
MALTENETRFLIWAILAILAVLAFIGGLVAKAIIKMGNDIGEIKVAVNTVATKHDEAEKRITRLENHVYGD